MNQDNNWAKVGGADSNRDNGHLASEPINNNKYL